MLSTAGYLTQTRHLNRLLQLTVVSMGLAGPETLKMIQLAVTRGMVDSTLEKKETGPAAWPETIWWPAWTGSGRDCAASAKAFMA